MGKRKICMEREKSFYKNVLDNKGEESMAD